MAETTQRVLRLLGLLEARATWQARELAERMDVTERTVRRDVTRLRELGYPVHAERGLEGGYSLGRGAKLPPLLLNDDEAVALVACLRMAALAGADDVGEAALRSLVKLNQILPPKLRALATAVDAATQTLPRPRPSVDLDMLQQLAVAQRDHTLVRFEYTKPSGEVTRRDVEPAKMMTQGDRWYLQGFDRLRDDWRVFRLDRMSQFRPSTFRFEPRPAPPWRFRRDLSERFECVLLFRTSLSADALVQRVPLAHRDDPVDDPAGGCRVRMGATSWDDLAWHVLWVHRDLGGSIEPVSGGLGANEAESLQAFRQALERIQQQATAITGLAN